MNPLILFFVTLLFFIAILLPIDRYSYPQRIGRSLFLCALFYLLVGLMANPTIAGFIGYALGAIVGTAIATFIARQSAIMGGK